MELTDVKFLTIVFRDMIGQKLAICPSINSKCATFCCAVRLTEPVGVFGIITRKPLSGEMLAFFPRVAWSSRNGAKFASNDQVYWRFWRQFSYDVSVSCFERDHCFGALCDCAVIAQVAVNAGNVQCSMLIITYRKYAFVAPCVWLYEYLSTSVVKPLPSRQYVRERLDNDENIY